MPKSGHFVDKTAILRLFVDKIRGLIFIVSKRTARARARWRGCWSRAWTHPAPRAARRPSARWSLTVCGTRMRQTPFAQHLLQGVPLDLRFERRPTPVHRIREPSVLHALEFSSHLEFLAPRAELKAPVGGRVAQKGWASFRARQAQQRFQGATHHVLSRPWVRIHQ